MADVLQYTQGAELPDVKLTWLDTEGQVIDFSTGWTFEFRVATTPVLIKTSGIVGATAAPNITIAFEADELDAVAPGTYPGQLWARRTADSKDRDPFPFTLRIVAAIT